jgi:hypothetical protein
MSDPEKVAHIQGQYQIRAAIIAVGGVILAAFVAAASAIYVAHRNAPGVQKPPEVVEDKPHQSAVEDLSPPVIEVKFQRGEPAFDDSENSIVDVEITNVRDTPLTLTRLEFIPTKIEPRHFGKSGIVAHVYEGDEPTKVILGSTKSGVPVQVPGFGVAVIGGKTVSVPVWFQTRGAKSLWLIQGRFKLYFDDDIPIASKLIEIYCPKETGITWRRPPDGPFVLPHSDSSGS